MSIRILAVLAFAVGIAGCGWLKSTSRTVADHAVDCTTAQAVKVAGELGSVVRPAVVAAVAGGDWAPLKTLAKDGTAEVLGCLLANVATDLERAIRGAPKTHAQQLDPDQLHAGVRALLVERFGNARTFQTPLGAL